MWWHVHDFIDCGPHGTWWLLPHDFKRLWPSWHVLPCASCLQEIVAIMACGGCCLMTSKDCGPHGMCCLVPHAFKRLWPSCGGCCLMTSIDCGHHGMCGCCLMTSIDCGHHGMWWLLPHDFNRLWPSWHVVAVASWLHGVCSMSC